LVASGLDVAALKWSTSSWTSCSLRPVTTYAQLSGGLSKVPRLEKLRDLVDLDGQSERYPRALNAGPGQVGQGRRDREGCSRQQANA
jgi:hypothetical protein